MKHAHALAAERPRCQRTPGHPNAGAPLFSENKRRRAIVFVVVVVVAVVVGIPTPMPDLLARVCVRGACDSPGSMHRCPAVVTAERVVVTKKSKPCFSFLEKKKNSSINTGDDHRHSPRREDTRDAAAAFVVCCFAGGGRGAPVSHTKIHPILHVCPAGGPMQSQQQQLRSPALSFCSYRCCCNVLSLILSPRFFAPTPTATTHPSAPRKQGNKDESTALSSAFDDLRIFGLVIFPLYGSRAHIRALLLRGSPPPIPEFGRVRFQSAVRGSSYRGFRTHKRTHAMLSPPKHESLLAWGVGVNARAVDAAVAVCSLARAHAHTRTLANVRIYTCRRRETERGDRFGRNARAAFRGLHTPPSLLITFRFLSLSLDSAVGSCAALIAERESEREREISSSLRYRALVSLLSVNPRRNAPVKNGSTLGQVAKTVDKKFLAQPQKQQQKRRW
ncbi:Uncharacterized protein FWK35_00006801 [Aphis craccivora]|uniref:Uncharacterized protein n=1 Tax=Aphis craccivora TaxID=307492 RepID=A0A6G0ZI04_APHCR|nr:Uncharacterized protein FWK35_00006801 [Aphis craccivora]